MSRSNEERLFGLRIRQARKALGLTQAQLAHELTHYGQALDPTMVAKIEAATRPTNVAEVHALCSVLAIEPSQMFGWEPTRAWDAGMRFANYVENGELGDWPRSWTRVVGAAIRGRRNQLGMSAEDLSEACGRRGLEIQRAVLSNLENGRREGITVHQLVIIAAALHVPPLALLFPSGSELIECWPGQRMSWDQCMVLFAGDEQLIRAPRREDFKSLGVAVAELFQQEIEAMTGWDHP